jgi:hypothetical protein
MEPGSSLPYSQEAATGFYPVPDEPTPHPLIILFQDYADVTLTHNRIFLSGFFSSGFMTEIACVFFNSPMFATCLTHLTLLDLVNIIIFSKD